MDFLGIIVNVWVIIIISALWLLFSIITQAISYKHGVWDGAFNQFLPTVRKYMREYDPVRARIILKEGGNSVHIKKKVNMEKNSNTPNLIKERKSPMDIYVANFGPERTP